MKHEAKWLVAVGMVGLLTCLALPALGSDQPEVPEPAAVETPATEPGIETATPEGPQAVEPAEADAEPRIFASPADLFTPDPAPASCCVDECRRDKQCDAVCGAPGAGVCIQVNSCCRECACTF